MENTDKLKIYTALEKYKGTEMPLADELRKLDDLELFVEKLSKKQISGEYPLLTRVDCPDGQTPVRLDLYCKPGSENLVLDWEDSNPFTRPWLKDGLAYLT